MNDNFPNGYSFGERLPGIGQGEWCGVCDRYEGKEGRSSEKGETAEQCF
jgi:hypothetical protein